MAGDETGRPLAYLVDDLDVRQMEVRLATVGCFRAQEPLPDRWDQNSSKE